MRASTHLVSVSPNHLVGDALQKVRVNAIGVKVGVRFPVCQVVTGNTRYLAAQHIHKADGRVLRHVAEALDGRYALGGIHLEVLERLAHGVDHAKAGRLGASK